MSLWLGNTRVEAAGVTMSCIYWISVHQHYIHILEYIELYYSTWSLNIELLWTRVVWRPPPRLTVDVIIMQYINLRVHLSLSHAHNTLLKQIFILRTAINSNPLFLSCIEETWLMWRLDLFDIDICLLYESWCLIDAHTCMQWHWL